MAAVTAPARAQPDLDTLAANRREALLYTQYARGQVSYWIARLEGANKELGVADERLEAARAAASGDVPTGDPQ